MSGPRPGTCGEPGPYATHCTLDPGHRWSCYDGSGDSSWNDRSPEDWQTEMPHRCDDPTCPGNQPSDSCRSCGGDVSARYQTYGVCQNCYGTTDDPRTQSGDRERCTDQHDDPQGVTLRCVLTEGHGGQHAWQRTQSGDRHTCGCDLTGELPPAIHIVDGHES